MSTAIEVQSREQETLGWRYSSDQPVARKRVLVVTYTFPPVGGAGVQRIAKFVKYLRRFGWEPTVLTVTNPSVPVFDASLDDDLPEDIRIIQTRSWEPGYVVKKAVAQGSAGKPAWRRYTQGLASKCIRSVAGLLLQPDPQILWYPSAVSRGQRLLQEQSFDAILATAPPFSALLVGRALARHSGLPLVVDYRDEWTISNEYSEHRKLDRFSSWWQRAMENRVLRASNAIIATTESSANALQRRRDEAGGKASLHCIYNGFDPDDFTAPLTSQSPRDRFRIIYTGTLWNLTSVEPVVQAVKLLANRRADLLSRLEFVFVGRRVGRQSDQVEQLKDLPCKTVVHDYMNHANALNLLHASHAGVILLSDVKGAERVVPAKLFEYVASRRKILAVAPQGEVWRLLSGISQAAVFSPRDVPGIAQWIEHELRRGETDSDLALSTIPVGFDRCSQTGQLAEILTTVSSRNTLAAIA